MKVSDLSEILKRIENLEKAVFPDSRKSESKTINKVSADITTADFSLNERAFVKRYAANKSGTKKFAILLSYIAKGDVNKDIERTEIESLWKKMKSKSLLGKFNGYYANEAKNQGLVDSKKRGFYNITEEWVNALQKPKRNK